MSDLHARQEIAELLVRYATGIDQRDWDLLRSCFTDDCQLDYGPIGDWNGADAVVAFMTDSHAQAGHSMHRITNATITVDGDRAEARSHVDALIMSADGKSGMNPVGFYDDDVVRTDSGWRIARRQFTMVHLDVISETS